MKKFLNISVGIFTFALWIFLIFSIFNESSTKELWRVPIFILLLAISVVLYFKAKQLSPLSHFLIGIMIIANTLGEIYLGLFYTFPIYDKILHFFIPFFSLFICYELLSPWIKENKKRLVFSIYLVFSLIIFWEIFEIAFDYFFDAPMIGVFIREAVSEEVYQTIEYLNPFLDTVYDIVLGIIGVIVATLILKKRKNI